MNVRFRARRAFSMLGIAHFADGDAADDVVAPALQLPHLVQVWFYDPPMPQPAQRVLAKTWAPPVEVVAATSDVARASFGDTVPLLGGGKVEDEVALCFNLWAADLADAASFSLSS